MPLLVAASPNHTTTLDLASNAFCRFQLSATMLGETPALALACRYPPQGDIIALLAVPVTVADSHEQVVQIANVGLAGGTLDADKERITEAYTLFKNNPRVPAQAALEEATNRGIEVVETYWKVRDWLINGCQEKLEVTLGDRALRGFS